MDLLYAIISAIVAAVVSAAVTWGAVKTEMKYFRRDIDQNRIELSRMNAALSQQSDILHMRINEVHEKIASLVK